MNSASPSGLGYSSGGGKSGPVGSSGVVRLWWIKSGASNPSRRSILPSSQTSQNRRMMALFSSADITGYRSHQGEEGVRLRGKTQLVKARVFCALEAGILLAGMALVAVDAS